jgi:hypothetical protein
VTEPDWAAHQRALFMERVELMVAAGLYRTGRIPVVLLVQDGERSAARLDPEFRLAQLPTPRAIDVARHADAAWRRWVPGLSPLDAGVFLHVEEEQARVLMGPCSDDARRLFEHHAPAMREAARQGGVDVEAIEGTGGEVPKGLLD